MASNINPQYYSSNYIFPNDFCQLPPPPPAAACCNMDAAAMWGEDSLNGSTFPYYGAAVDSYMVPLPPESDIMSSVSLMSLPERLGISDMQVVPTLPEFKMAGSQSLGGRHCELGEEDQYCSGIVSDFGAILVDDNWGIHGKPVAAAIEEPSVKVGRYSVEERKDRILRYLKKRNQRNFNKTIKYACRKTLADKRVRVRGRFARNNELGEEEGLTKKNINIPHLERDFYDDYAVQIKHDGEDWLQEAMTSFMYYHTLLGDQNGAMLKC